MKTVVVGMSGGVDSSVAAYLLKEQGYRVIGLFMKNWEEDDECPAEEDAADVAAVCGQLEIPFYAVNFSKEYWERVFARCLEEYRAGTTPNPDILCNREIKFHLFFEKALELGGDYLATGHYCRTQKRGGEWRLLRGVDPDKDQSYFLYAIDKKVLSRVLFPLGEMRKREVRALATQIGLATATKKDSTGICFIGKRNFKKFLQKFISDTPGNFETLAGKVVGRHDGLSYYTIGQRRGLTIGGIQGREEAPWYVVGKEASRNVILVEQGEKHPALHTSSLVAQEIHWLGTPPPLPLRCHAQIRYRQRAVPCSLDQNHIVTFDTPQKAVTPRQSIVFYDGETCLGGGMIQLTP